MISKTEKYIIEDVLCWMDGGTVTLKMRDPEGETFDIEFAQKVLMKRYEGHPKPGSLSLNRKEVEVRSEEETHVLAVVESAVWGEKILAREKGSYSKIIGDCIDFVRSDRYLTMSKINPTT